MNAKGTVGQAVLAALSSTVLFFCSTGPLAFGQSPPVHHTMPSLPLAFGESAAFHKQIVQVLSSLPKTLLLEESRGATNVLVYRKASPATVLIVTDDPGAAGGYRFGSGVIISPTGSVITNYHVVRQAKRIVVFFKPQSGVEVKRELARAAIPTKIDEVADLALLQVKEPPPNLPYLSLGSTPTPEVGDDVHAIGHPEGEVWRTQPEPSAR
jgi:S1-C subfamily serine protease